MHFEHWSIQACLIISRLLSILIIKIYGHLLHYLGQKDLTFARRTSPTETLHLTQIMLKPWVVNIDSEKVILKVEFSMMQPNLRCSTRRLPLKFVIKKHNTNFNLLVVKSLSRKKIRAYKHFVPKYISFLTLRTVSNAFKAYQYPTFLTEFLA